MGGGTGGGSSGRAKCGVACLSLENALVHHKRIAILTNSNGFMSVSSNWVGEGKDPFLCHFPDGDILARIINVLQRKMNLGFFTIFNKLKAHRGEFFSGKADRWADEG